MKKIFNSLTSKVVCVFALALFTGMAYGQCPVGETNISATYTTGAFNNENGWLLWNASAGSVVLDGGNDPAAGTMKACVPDGDVIELYSFETFGDGWNTPANLVVSTCETGAVNGCAEQTDDLFTWAHPDTGTGGAANMGAPGGLLAQSFSVACVVATCEIVCPADIAVGNDPGECSAAVELPDPVLMLSLIHI